MPTMTTTGRKGQYRTRIAAQNLMEGDECFHDDESKKERVRKIARYEDQGWVEISFENRKKSVLYPWGEFIDIIETPERHLYRRNSLRRNGYPNFMQVVSGRAMARSPIPTPKRKPKAKRSRR